MAAAMADVVECLNRLPHAVLDTTEQRLRSFSFSGPTSRKLKSVLNRRLGRPNFTQSDRGHGAFEAARNLWPASDFIDEDNDTAKLRSFLTVLREIEGVAAPSIGDLPHDSSTVAAGDVEPHLLTNEEPGYSRTVRERKEQESKTPRPIDEAVRLPGLTVEGRLAAAEEEIAEKRSEILHIVETTIRGLGHVHVDSADEGRQLAAHVTNFARKHGLWFRGRGGAVGNLTFATGAASSQKPGDFFIRGPSGMEAVSDGFGSLSLLPRPDRRRRST
jgi:hypothetical protein